MAIVRALVTKPAIILADEPTGNLDTAASHDVIGLLKVLARQYQQTIILITHDGDIAQMADRTVRIEDGKIRSSSRVERVLPGETETGREGDYPEKRRQGKKVISMLANNNQAIIRRLAKNTVRTNKKQFGILFLTSGPVGISAFLCVYYRHYLAGSGQAAEYKAERRGV